MVIYNRFRKNKMLKYERSFYQNTLLLWAKNSDICENKSHIKCHVLHFDVPCIKTIASNTIRQYRCLRLML